MHISTSARAPHVAGLDGNSVHHPTWALALGNVPVDGPASSATAAVEQAASMRGRLHATG